MKKRKMNTKEISKKMKPVKIICTILNWMKENADIAFFGVSLIIIGIALLAPLFNASSTFLTFIISIVLGYSMIWIISCFIVSPIINKVAKRYAIKYTERFLEEQRYEKMKKRTEMGLR